MPKTAIYIDDHTYTRFRLVPDRRSSIPAFVSKNRLLGDYLDERSYVSSRIPNVATGWTVRGSNPGGGDIFRTRPDRP